MKLQNEKSYHAAVLREMTKNRYKLIRRIVALLKEVENLQRLTALFSSNSKSAKYFQLLITNTQDKIDCRVDELLLQEKQLKDYAVQHDNGHDLELDDVQHALKADAFFSIFRCFFQISTYR